MARGRCRIVKLGGSLLRQSGAWPQLGQWLLRDAPTHQVVVTGGGEWADAIRTLDIDAGLSVDQSHWLAIRAMSLTAWTFAALHPRFVYLDRWSSLERALEVSLPPALLVFDTAAWLLDEETQSRPGRLPLGWQVTSDSIAAHLAMRLDADELLLLKSASGPRDAGEPLVDEYFATARQSVRRVRLVNLVEALASERPHQGTEGIPQEMMDAGTRPSRPVPTTTSGQPGAGGPGSAGRVNG
jgi:aspartokinase-like uncharacterized kinase